MFPLCLLAKIEVYMIIHKKNIYFIVVEAKINIQCKIEVYIINNNKNFGVAKRIMLAKIEVYIINDNKNIYFLSVLTNVKL